MMVREKVALSFGRDAHGVRFPIIQSNDKDDYEFRCVMSVKYLDKKNS